MRTAFQSFAAVASVLVCTFLGACASAPSLTMTGATVVSESDDSVVLAIHLDATNPNDTPLPLRVASYTVSVAGAEAFSGDRSAQATVPPNTTHRLVLPAVVRRTGAHIGTEIAISGSLEYVPESKLSEVAYDLGFGWSSTGFDGRGPVVAQSPPLPVRPPNPPPVAAAKP